MPPIELRGKKRPQPPLLVFDFDIFLQQNHASDAATKVQATSGKRQNRKSEKMILWSSYLTRSRSVEFEKAVKYEKVEECCHKSGSSRRTRFMKQDRTSPAWLRG